MVRRERSQDCLRWLIGWQLGHHHLDHRRRRRRRRLHQNEQQQCQSLFPCHILIQFPTSYYPFYFLVITSFTPLDTPIFSINSSSGASDLSYLDFDRFVLWWCLDYLEVKAGEPWFSSVTSWDSQLVGSFQSSQSLGLLEWFKDTLNFCHCQSLLLRRFCNQIIFSSWYVVRSFS